MYNSPITNMMYQQVNGYYPPNQNYIPPNPIGNNMVGIGNNGYNTMGGYYSNNYNYYNPYAAIKQREMQEIQYREQQKKQSNILKNISRNVKNALNIEVDENHLSERWDPTQVTDSGYSPKELEIMKTNNLIQLYNNERSYVNYRKLNYIRMSNNLYDNTAEKYNDMSLYEYMKNGYELYQNAIKENQRKSQKNLGQLYNSSQYNQLIKMHSNSTNYFNTMFGNNCNIDDNEITLPGYLSKVSQDRKQQFLNSIMGGNTNG